MATDCITQVTFRGDGFAKPVVARFDLPHASTDGGLLLVKALDTQLGLTGRLAACLDDAREPGKVLHETIELLQQRIFGLVLEGYADLNDAARLVHDPIHKLVVVAHPLTGLGRGLATHAVAVRERGERARVARHDPRAGRHRDRAAAAALCTGAPRGSRIDLYPTDYLTHGQQEFAFFNGHYDTGRLPVVATVTFNHGTGAVRGRRGAAPGKAAGLGAGASCGPCCASSGAPSPGATFRVRLDGRFASPKLFRFLRAGDELLPVVARAAGRLCGEPFGR